MRGVKPLAVLLVAMMLGLLAIGIVGYHTLKNSLIESKKRDVAVMLNIARSQSTRYIEMHQQGVLTKEQAEEKIIQFLSSLRYESAYVWSNDNNGIARVHPREEVVGQFQSSYAEHIANLTNDNIYYRTKSNVKPVTNQLTIKTNGVVKMPEWDWVIGFGLYMDDVNRLIIESSVSFVTTIISAMLLVFFIALYWIRRVKRQ